MGRAGCGRQGFPERWKRGSCCSPVPAPSQSIHSSFPIAWHNLPIPPSEVLHLPQQIPLDEPAGSLVVIPGSWHRFGSGQERGGNHTRVWCGGSSKQLSSRPARSVRRGAKALKIASNPERRIPVGKGEGRESRRLPKACVGWQLLHEEGDGKPNGGETLPPGSCSPENSLSQELTEKDGHREDQELWCYLWKEILRRSHPA